VRLPTYIRNPNLKPDLPGDNVVADGYFTYPKQQFQSVSQVPGAGGDVSAMAIIWQAPPTAFEQNLQWQEVNKRLGVNLKMLNVPFADYSTRFASVVAGTDLPDIFYVPANAPIPNLDQLLAATCADVTPYLSGDAISVFSNLANIPSQCWRNTVFNEAIYGTPQGSTVFFWTPWVHQEMLDQANLGPPTNADEFKKQLQTLTDPDKGLYGIGLQSTYGITNGFFPAMFGAPNNWAVVSGGQFTKDWETDQYRAALGYAHDLYAAGVIHPSSATNNLLQTRQDFVSRKFAYVFDSLVYSQIWDPSLKLQPPTTLRLVAPFSDDGKRQPVYYFGSGSNGFSAIKKATPERVQELLHILNFVAAPIGSEEYTLLGFGIEGTHFTFDTNGNPVLTDQGKADVAMPWNSTIGNTMAQQVPVLYDPNSADWPNATQPWEKATQPIGVLDPSVGLYSPTGAAKAAVLNSTMADGIADIVTGRRPLSDFDQLVRDWRSNGGDQIRAELQALVGTSS
jgi:putative aldouronate transport system substrate-binding protein